MRQAVNSSRIFELFQELCDLPEAEVHRRLAAETESCRARVLEMLRADRFDSTPLDGEVVLEAITVDIADDMSGRIPEAWKVPPYVPGLRLGAELGRGAMGVVVAAAQLEPAREVAVKFLAPAVVESVEAHMLARLRHPAIPVVYQVGQLGGIQYLVMERCQGTPLLEWCAENSQDDVLQLFIQICDAVEHAHRAGVLHRDIKPTNILVDRGSAWVLDFGLARIGAEAEEGVIGTLPYLADECLTGAPASEASDVYSLGVMLAEMLGCERPTPRSLGTPRQQRKLRERRPPGSFRLHANPPVDAVLRKALAPLPSRYPQVNALREDVRALLEHRPPRAYPGTPVYRFRKFVRRNPLVLLVVGGVAVLTVAIGWFPVQEWRRQNASLARAERVASEVRNSIDRALGDDDPDAAERALQLALVEPDLAGTRPAVLLQLHLGTELQKRRDTARATRWLARAYTETAEEDVRSTVAASFATSLADQRAWTGLDLISKQLQEPLRSQLRTRLALGRRDFLDPSVPPRWHFLSSGRRLDYHPVAMQIGADGMSMLESEEKRLVDTTLGGDLLRFHPLPPGWDSSRIAISAVDASGQVWWASASSREGGVSVWKVTPRGIRAQGSLGIAGVPLSAVFADLDGDGREQLFIGNGPPDRPLLAFDPRQGRFEHLDRDIDALRSDLNDLQVLDVDRDGHDDLLVFQGAWRAYDLKVLAGSDAAPEQVQRVRLGGTVIAGVVERPGGPWLALWKNDDWAIPSLFGQDHPAGIPPGLYLVEPVPGGFEVRGHIPSFVEPEAPRDVIVGDFDGDGWKDIAVLSAHRAMSLIRLGPDGIIENVTIEKVVPMAAADVDGDGDDELFARLEDDDQRLWILGMEGSAVPLVQPPRIVTEGPAGLSDRSSLLFEMGLFTEAMEALQARADGTRDPVRARERWATVAELAQMDEVRRPDVAERALEIATKLGADPTALQELRIRRHRFPDDRPMQVPLDQPVLQVHRPAVVRRKGDGLSIFGVGRDGLLLSAPVRRTGPHLEIAMDLLVHQAERGAHLLVSLLDSAGRTVSSVRFQPYGGSRTVARAVGCSGPNVALTDYASLRTQDLRAERIGVRVSEHQGEFLCGITRDGRFVLEYTRSPRRTVYEDPVRLEVRMLEIEGEQGSALNVTLEHLTLTGVELLPIEPGPAETWVWGSQRGALPALVDSPSGPLLQAEIGDLESARRTLDQAPEAWWIGALRRDPVFWITVLANDLDLLGRRYAAAWSGPTANAARATTRASLAHPLIDFLPVTPETRKLLTNRADALLEAGEYERAQQIQFRLTTACADDCHYLGLAESHLALGDLEEAGRFCRLEIERAVSPGLVLDRLSTKPDLWKACGSPPLTPTLVPLAGVDSGTGQR